MNPRLIVTLSGAFLIVVGVALVTIQFYLQYSDPTLVVTLPTREVSVEGGGVSANLKTTYVGLVLVVFGIILEALGLRKGGENDRDT